ncbi:hypothetical protein [Brevibacillus laterosporus]|nr:hypothetical protein [Brevibacillus laterosporus]ERM18287.1 hypothetical protein P615_18240 [Brevibacillus laterosporus PE36]
MHKKWSAQEKLAVLQEIERGQIGLAAVPPLVLLSQLQTHGELLQ